jgi:hypothetical protein
MKRIRTLTKFLAACLLLLMLKPVIAAGQQPPAPVHGQNLPPQQPAAPQVNEWVAKFEGDRLDPEKWERFSFEGDPGVSVKLAQGELRMRGTNRSRSGVRTKQMFSGERFIVDATLAKVGRRLPAADSPDDTGFAVLAVLFGGSDLNRLEWILRSDGRLEAWLMRVNEPSEELDNHKLGIKVPNPTLGIARRGDDFLFLINGQLGLQKTVHGLGKDFQVMLYGYGSSENSWKSLRVVTPKQ